MNRKKHFLVISVFAIILILLSVSSDASAQTEKYIRFHVIANSDSPEDQALKLRVRDRLLDRFSDQFSSAATIDDVRIKIQENLQTIKDIALSEIQRSGSEYTVNADLGYFDFPTKAYGDLVLDAGRYEALRVVIGEGKGANWWCVMFPPLCFVDISHGVASQPEKSQWDEEDIKDAQTEETRVEYRFKFLEWWEAFKDWISGIISFGSILSIRY